MGYENGHLVRRAQAIRRDVVAPSRSGTHCRESAAAFPRRLCATATAPSDNADRRDKQMRELYPDVVDGLEDEGGVPSRLIKTDAGDGRQEGTPWRMFAGSP
ncbi:MAG: hypothetical protein M3Q43_01700, partial [Actinomycetota bacterium]|nr:hypothetical protein [Actinomycetota bacterium]